MSSKLSVGIVGLPNVGKSTLFNALTKKITANASNFPFCTIEPNVGIVDVDDPRIRELSKLSSSKKLIYATLNFVDIAGLVKGASKGEGLGNKFLSNIRETDVILHVVRCFDDDNVVHVDGRVDPIADIEIINLELILADLQMCDNSLVKANKLARTNKDAKPTVDALEKIKSALEKEIPVRAIELTEDEKKALKTYNFLTAKKVIYAANCPEGDYDNDHVKKVFEYAQKEHSEVIPISAKLEEELAGLPPEEALEFLQSTGMEQSGLDRLIKAGFETLHLITYLTTGDIETRAWTIKKGTNAQEAAGKIHTDIQKGFIRAEVVSYDDMMQYKSRAAAREAGKARAEGKDYIVKDGDVILFFHN